MSTIGGTLACPPLGALTPCTHTVGFAVKHAVVATFRGEVRGHRRDPRVELRAATWPSTAAVDVSAASPSRTPTCRGHLLSPDFFDAAQTPADALQPPRTFASPTHVPRSIVHGELRSRARARPCGLTAGRSPRRPRPHSAARSLGPRARGGGRSPRLRTEMEHAAAQGRVALGTTSSWSLSSRCIAQAAWEPRCGSLESADPAYGLPQRRPASGGAQGCCRPVSELVELIGLEDLPLPSRRTTTPAEAARRGGRLPRALESADAVLISTPEYNSSIPGQLKNALDWASRPFATNALRNRPVAVISASTSLFGGVWAAAELRKVLARIGARVVDRSSASRAPTRRSTRAAGWRTTSCARSSATCSASSWPAPGARITPASPRSHWRHELGAVHDRARGRGRADAERPPPRARSARRRAAAAHRARTPARTPGLPAGARVGRPPACWPAPARSSRRR